MTREENFLITYGLHNFVTVTNQRRATAFTISGTEGPGMIRHATNLIRGAYGDATPIHTA